MSYADDREIRRVRNRRDDGFEESRWVRPGTIASEGGSTTYDALGPSFTWARFDNRPEGKVPVYNPTTIKEEGSPVLIARNPKGPYRWEIIGPNDNYLGDVDDIDLSRYNASIHGENHQISDEADPGPDPVRVFQPMFMPLKTEGDGTSLTVTTYSYIYTKSGVRYEFGGQQTDLTSYVPGAGLIRRVLLYLNRDTNVLNIVSGTAVTDDTITPIPYPAPPSGVDARESAWVTLANGQTTVTTGTDIVDGRDTLDNGETNGLPVPTEFGQILMYDDGGIMWVTPMVDEDGNIMTDEDQKIMYVG